MPDSSARSVASMPRQPTRAGVRLDGSGTRLARAMASPPLRRLAQLLLIVLLAFLSARLTWQLLTPVGAFGAAPVDATAAGPADPALAARAFAQGGDAAAALPAADLGGLALFGVRVATDPARSTAILGTAGGPQASYAVGDTVAAGTTLASVEAAHVVLSRGGAPVRLALPEAPAPHLGAPPPAPASLPAAPSVATPAAFDPAQLLAQAGLRPRQRDGGADGYTVIPRGDGALLRQAGLQAGDVLLAVNGQALTPERIGELDQILRSAPSAVVTLERGGERLTLTLPLEPP